MEEHTIALLQECSQGCKMGIKSMNQVQEYVSEQKMKKMIGQYIKAHQELEKEADRQLTEHGTDSKPAEKLASAMSWFTTEMKMMMNDDTKQAAKILMDGCNMGIQSICGFINQYSGADKESIELAKKLVKTEESFRDELKEYV